LFPYQTEIVNWVGTWKNQYGSILKILAQRNGLLEGTIESAVVPDHQRSKANGDGGL
jgi:hypothetical protein